MTLCTSIHSPLRETGLGVGVHLTLLRSLSFGFAEPSQPDSLPIASALRAAAVPIVDLSSNRFAAGVSAPGASARRGVHEGGGIDPFLAALVGVRGARPGKPSSPAFARSDFAALFESLCESRSRAEGAAIRKGVFGVGTSSGLSAGSSD